MAETEKYSLGQLLIEKGIITVQQLEMALAEQGKTGELLGAVLMRLGFVDTESIYMPILAEQIGIPYLNLANIQIRKEVIDRIPAHFVKAL